MTKVEFRLLQVMLSAVSGDRVTVALVHWDGSKLRVASSMNALVAVEREHREGIRLAAEDVVRHAQRAAKRVALEPVLNVGLAHLFPVREGTGAALSWTPIIAMLTADPEAHFAELRRDLRLDPEHLVRARRVTQHWLYTHLQALGVQLLNEGAKPTRVRMNWEVSARLSYEAPLSWKNAKWHHTVPSSLEGLDRSQMIDELRRVYGLVDLSFPANHVAVIIPALPTKSDARAEAERDLARVHMTLRSKRSVEVFVPERKGKWLGLEPLAERVRSDIVH